jgi:hypothetical protein
MGNFATCPLRAVLNFFGEGGVEFSAPTNEIAGEEIVSIAGEKGVTYVATGKRMRHFMREVARREVTMVKWVAVLEDVVNVVDVISASVPNRDSEVMTWVAMKG